MSINIIDLGDDDAVRDFYKDMRDPRLASIKKDDKVPRVGDIVVLNDNGLEQIFSTTRGLSHMKTIRMKVTRVEDESATYPEPTFGVEVDNQDINQFMIDHNCFDIVASPHECRIETNKECGCGFGQCKRGLIY